MNYDPTIPSPSPAPAKFARTSDERLAAQLHFIIEVDRLKGILRQSVITDRSRRENSAEHSWHIALVALVLHEYAPVPINLERVLTMLLVHDIVEIEAGDAFVYDPAALAGKEEREQLAADKLFGLLPADIRDRLRGAWDEFESRATPEARFANAVDRLMPMMHNFASEGQAWIHHGVRRSQVLAYNQHMAEGAPTLWEYAKELIEQSVTQGFLKEG
jgi:putative hydrolase of HD superfamily